MTYNGPGFYKTHGGKIVEITDMRGDKIYGRSTNQFESRPNWDSQGVFLGFAPPEYFNLIEKLDGYVAKKAFEPNSSKSFSWDNLTEKASRK